MAHEKNKEAFEFLGITKFHEKGFTGKNVILASKENVIDNVFNKEQVICLDPYEKATGRFAKHGTNVMDYILQVCPDGKKYAINPSSKYSLQTGLISEEWDYILAHKPDVLTTSEWRENRHGRLYVKNVSRAFR